MGIVCDRFLYRVTKIFWNQTEVVVPSHQVFKMVLFTMVRVKCVNSTSIKLKKKYSLLPQCVDKHNFTVCN